jgi:hypothetical protein
VEVAMRIGIRGLVEGLYLHLGVVEEKHGEDEEIQLVVVERKLEVEMI